MKRDSQHITFDDLFAFNDGRLDLYKANQCAKHLETCEECRNTLEAMQEFDSIELRQPHIEYEVQLLDQELLNITKQYIKESQRNSYLGKLKGHFYKNGWRYLAAVAASLLLVALFPFDEDSNTDALKAMASLTQKKPDNNSNVKKRGNCKIGEDGKYTWIWIVDTGIDDLDLNNTSSKKVIACNSAGGINHSLLIDSLSTVNVKPVAPYVRFEEDGNFYANSQHCDNDGDGVAQTSPSTQVREPDADGGIIVIEQGVTHEDENDIIINDSTPTEVAIVDEIMNHEDRLQTLQGYWDVLKEGGEVTQNYDPRFNSPQSKVSSEIRLGYGRITGPTYECNIKQSDIDKYVEEQNYLYSVARRNSTTESRTLNLDNKIDISSLPPKIEQLKSLQTLDLDSVKLNSLPSEIGQLQSLKRLNLLKLSDESLEKETNNKTAKFCSNKNPNVTLQDREITGARLSDSLNLVKFYESTNGENWTNKWDLAQPMDEWYGVDLDNSGRVSTLTLNENNLIGEMPPEIGNLDNLLFIVASGNNLTGNIPDFWSTNLEIMNVSRNHFTGTIPNFSNCAKLKKLSLANNQLTGKIPDFSNSPKLTYLDLSYNQLSIDIPQKIYDMGLLYFNYIGNKPKPFGED